MRALPGGLVLGRIAFVVGVGVSVLIGRYGAIVPGSGIAGGRVLRAS